MAQRRPRPQVNVPLDDFLMDVAAVISVRDQTSIGSVLREPVESFLRRRLKDTGVADAVNGIRRSRQEEGARRDRTSVTPLRPRRGSAGAGRKRN
jgi:hypothetical protein